MIRLSPIANLPIEYMPIEKEQALSAWSCVDVFTNFRMTLVMEMISARDPSEAGSSCVWATLKCGIRIAVLPNCNTHCSPPWSMA